ncbi:DegP protease 7 [Actinidia rufa]|uniref:DegP protease 7 n=1 Tax=Actinidia rufa TaxID=165716 RepID=A0A7J0DK24_9ERIC|nr:DegP protease 7 [Actinidia rufa]
MLMCSSKHRMLIACSSLVICIQVAWIIHVFEAMVKCAGVVAASGTKGGSSGSPVIDWQGRAVALNAGSKSSSASAFFLPLERRLTRPLLQVLGSNLVVHIMGPPQAEPGFVKGKPGKLEKPFALASKRHIPPLVLRKGAYCLCTVSSLRYTSWWLAQLRKSSKEWWLALLRKSSKEWQRAKVVRALGFLQKGRDSFSEKWDAVTIPRGTLQATFLHKGFDETRRLGLRSETEQMVRLASPLGETGMLVVDSVVPGGPGHKLLEPGDVLVRINGDVITQFLKMETLFDDSVDQKIELQIERGGTPLTVELVVQDLHSITPDSFLEVSGGVIHPLSYQQYGAQDQWKLGILGYCQGGVGWGQVHSGYGPSHFTGPNFFGCGGGSSGCAPSSSSRGGGCSALGYSVSGYSVGRGPQKCTYCHQENHTTQIAASIACVASSSPWVIDFGASAYMTGTLGHLTNLSPSRHLSCVILPDGSPSSIHGLGSSCLVSFAALGSFLLVSTTTPFDPDSLPIALKKGNPLIIITVYYYCTSPSYFIPFSLGDRLEIFVSTVALYMLFRAGVPRHAIIKKLGGEEISRLEDLISVLSKLARGARVPLEYISYMDRHRRKSVLVTIDRHEWYAPPQIYTLPLDTDLASIMELMHQDSNQELIDGVSSMETCSEHVAEGPNSRDDLDIGTKKRRVEEDSSADSIVVANCSLDEPREEKLEALTNSENALLRDYQGATAVAANASVAERVIEPTLVMLEVHVPPSCMLDGEVFFLHPVHNYALVAYDPSALGPVGASVVRAVELLPDPPLRRGDTVYLVGLSRSLQATSRKSVVTNPYAALNIGSADCPRYRATNMEVIELDTDFGITFSGVLTDEHGRVQAIWGSFSTQLKYGGSSSEDHQFVRGIPVYAISQVLDKIVSGANGPILLINGIRRPMPLVRILEVEFYPTLLSKARSFGLNDKWVQTLVKKDPIRRQVLRVKGCLAGSKADKLLEQGDMVLAINKKPITCFRDIEDACQALNQCDEKDGKLNMTIFRQGREIEIPVGTDVRDGNGTPRVINWCGCIVQDPHPAVRALGFLPEEGHGVYVTRWCHGSPVHRYGLYALQWIVEVNGKPTPDLDAFVGVTKEINDGEFVRRVRTVHLNGKPRVMTLKQDLHYWPTWELRFDPDTAMWRRRTIKALDSSIA